MPSVRDWSRAFAKQAGADFASWNALLLKGAPLLPRCHKLHFLQMACEKLAKAHLLAAGSSTPSDLEHSHAYIAKTLPAIVRQQMTADGENERVANQVRNQCKRLAREIELLSPAVKDGGRREDNCEYPWEQGSVLHVPAEWPFSSMDLLTQPQGRNILKRIRKAIDRLAT